jgi:3-isopropylmalate/(R)-2-methylmalate dehydratase small subunit
MNPIRTVSGTMVPLDRSDVDTDQIIPQQFLKRIERDGYGDFLFHSWAHEGDQRRPDFILNEAPRKGAKVLVTGHNFGCGSSREHAAWAIQQWGFEAVVATSFADIFRSNAVNIGLLPVVVDVVTSRHLLQLAESPAATVTIDLGDKTLTAEGLSVDFNIDDDARIRLLEGLDRIGETMQYHDELSAHEARRPGWLAPTPR